MGRRLDSATRLTIVPRVRYTFVQLRAFSAEVRRVGLTAEDLRDIQTAIMRAPLAWPVIAGTGGLRKMRHAPRAGGGGKSGGVRVCYFVIDDAGRVYLVTLFAKNEKQNLSKADRNSIHDLISRIKANVSTEAPHEKGKTHKSGA